MDMKVLQTEYLTDEGHSYNPYPLHSGGLPLKPQSQLQQTTNFATSFLIFEKNKV